MSEKKNIGFNFNNSYTTLNEKLFSLCFPTPVHHPRVVTMNITLAKELGLNLNDFSETEVAQIFSGNKISENSQPFAQAYAGHQFGNFTVLGDGRAILLGEHITPEKKRFDIQLKGSGPTPYSRRGDGRATLSSMLREYIISEAMYALGIPTTRSLMVIATEEEIYREQVNEGAVLTRIANSHIRVGTFEYVRRFTDVETFRSFTNYTIERHYPDITNTENPALDLLKAVMEKQIELIVNWMRVGFIHGVMNTDNMSISGETIDYGPCAFMNAYNPQTVFSSIDHNGRYAFNNQPAIAHWNLSRFAETLLILIHPESTKAIELAQEVLDAFNPEFKKQWMVMMGKKLGITAIENHDEKLIQSLLAWMHSHSADYTNTFSALQSGNFPAEEIYQDTEFKEWYKQWRSRIEKESVPFELMKKNNPSLIPRNHMVELALNNAAFQNDLEILKELLSALSDPYSNSNEYALFKQPPEISTDKDYKTFCGT